MIEHQPRWYHHLMISLPVQMLIVLVAVLILGIQVLVYEYMEEDMVIFDGSCDVTVGPRDEQGEVTRKGATMQCGDDVIDLGTLETPYLYELLTNKREPVIVCVKTVSEYLKNVNWQCEMDPEERTEET